MDTADGAGELFVFELGAPDEACTMVVTPTLVLHGGPGADMTYMLPIASGLESDIHFVFYDQRGSLRSRVNLDSISMPHHVADIESIRQALGVERVNILSHSAGTLLAFEYLEAHPKRVQNLVLVGALPHKNGRRYYDAEYAALWEGLADDSRAFQEREAVTVALREAGLDSPTTPRQRGQAALVRQVGAESVRVDLWREALPMRVKPDAARRTRESTTYEYDYSELLAAHPFRVTVINGECDFTVGPRGSPLWRRLTEMAAPNVDLVVVPDASHIVWRDRPEVFREALSRALTE
jgi:pimeloyl-ACP methyl ester carboxylesterase